ncbi:MAG: Gfo/Idh/MocA family oxidoreductase [Melioribacteraceae bacterium]|nr:Gfo/Idh/MocA family oxidoreductase [Melioribacteraceae bacterium]
MKENLNFAITGVGGYIAPRHLKAIKETNNNLIASFDPNDSVGILDSYFPNSQYFYQYERFERFLSKRNDIEFLSICSPNYLHDTQIRLALNNGINSICEKPIVLFPHNLDSIEKLQEKTGKKVFTIMQLRYHPQIMKLKNQLAFNKKYNVELNYITPRGNWYFYSWKGDDTKSGGLIMNIGIHLFDLMIFLFGKVISIENNLNEINKASGKIEFENAFVKWFLSIDEKDLLKKNFSGNKRTYRSLIIDNEEIEFSEGFQDLHTKVYEEIINGNGLGIEDARPSIELVNRIKFLKTK